MAKGKTDIDGYTVFKAARKANETAAKKRAKSTPKAEEEKDQENMVRASASGGGTKRGEAPGTRIGRTAMPSKNKITCYHCGHISEIVGKQTAAVCPAPKCRERLDLTDTTVNAAAFRKNVTSAGDLVVNSRGEVTGGDITVNNVIVKGKIRGGTIKAMGQVRLHPGASVDLSCIEASDLIIIKGLELDTKNDLSSFDRIEVHGSLAGNIKPRGGLILHKTGTFTGSIQTSSLDIHDGGILKADLNLHPALAAPPAKKTETKATASTSKAATKTTGAKSTSSTKSATSTKPRDPSS